MPGEIIVVVPVNESINPSIPRVKAKMIDVRDLDSAGFPVIITARNYGNNGWRERIWTLTRNTKMNRPGAFVLLLEGYRSDFVCVPWYRFTVEYTELVALRST